MEIKKTMTHKFYKNLGKLFYAVAASDNHVTHSELSQLKALVKSKWLNVDSIKDDYDTDAAYQIEIVFDWLNNQEHLNATSCYDDFIDYKNEQKHLFTPKINKLIQTTASGIAAAFSGVNKSELIILAKLDMDLKK